MTISSEGDGRGAVVTMRFPLVAGERPVAELAPLGQALEALRILVVDDVDDVRDFNRRDARASWGPRSSRRGTGSTRSSRWRPAGRLVLCDLRMPRMDGFEFLRIAPVDRGAQPPVIAISGLASSADHLRTSAAGFEDHIDKPFDERRVVSAVGAAVARRAH